MTLLIQLSRQTCCALLGWLRLSTPLLYLQTCPTDTNLLWQVHRWDSWLRVGFLLLVSVFIGAYFFLFVFGRADGQSALQILNGDVQ